MFLILALSATTNPYFVCDIMQAGLLTKKNFLLYFDAGLEHMATWHRGNGSYVGWLR